ncbi:hypothetical protein GCM10027592_56300 [Spirosoma flavus]
MTASGVSYFAEITNSPLRFVGYRRIKTPLCQAEYYHITDPSLYPTLPTGQVAQMYYLQDYSRDEECGVAWLEGSFTLAPDANHQPVSLPLPAANWPHANQTRFASCSSVVTIAGNVFVLEVVNGNLRVRGTWQDFGKCASCPAQAEAALQAALSKARAANAGVLSLTTMVVSATTMSYGDAGDVVYQPMTLMDLLANLSKSYNSLVDKAKVPEEVW